MSSRPISLRIPEEIRATIEEIARRQRRDFSSVANEMLEEAVRMRRIPGIVFAEENGRRAVHVAGTGLEVWEIARSYLDGGQSWEGLREAYPWLDELQLRAALAYAEAYSDEVNARIREDDEWTPERIYSTYPFMRPPWA